MSELIPVMSFHYKMVSGYSINMYYHNSVALSFKDMHALAPLCTSEVFQPVHHSHSYGLMVTEHSV